MSDKNSCEISAYNDASSSQPTPTQASSSIPRPSLSDDVGGVGSRANSTPAAVDELPLIQLVPVVENSPRSVVNLMELEYKLFFPKALTRLLPLVKILLTRSKLLVSTAASERIGELKGLIDWYKTAKIEEITNISDQFVSSQEFSNTYGEQTKLEFVDEMYNNVLGRSVDSVGTDGWTN